MLEPGLSDPGLSSLSDMLRGCLTVSSSFGFLGEDRLRSSLSLPSIAEHLPTTSSEMELIRSQSENQLYGGVRMRQRPAPSLSETITPSSSCE